MHVKDVRPAFRWATKNKLLWRCFATILLPAHLIVYTLDGFVSGYKEWKGSLKLAGDYGHWHRDNVIPLRKNKNINGW